MQYLVVLFTLALIWQRIEVTLPYLQSLAHDDGSAPPLASRKLVLTIRRIMESLSCYYYTNPLYMVRHRGNAPRTPCLMVKIVGSAPTQLKI